MFAAALLSNNYEADLYFRRSAHFKFLRPIELPFFLINMAHRLIKLLFLAQFLCLDHVVAFPVLIGRDEPGGDSLWRLEWDDVTAGLEAIFKVWDFSTALGVSTTPSGVPSEQSDERRPETPDPVAFPLFEPTEMKKTCAVAGGSQGGQSDWLAVENSWWQVEQEPETGYVPPPPNKGLRLWFALDVRREEMKKKQRVY